MDEKRRFAWKAVCCRPLAVHSFKNEAWSWTRRANGTVCPEPRRHIV
jgi:hypothetical protein